MPAIASTSSKKRTHGVLLTRLREERVHVASRCCRATYRARRGCRCSRRIALTSPAVARARYVLPQPGGPYIRDAAAHRLAVLGEQRRVLQREDDLAADLFLNGLHPAHVGEADGRPVERHVEDAAFGLRPRSRSAPAFPPFSRSSRAASRSSRLLTPLDDLGRARESRRCRDVSSNSGSASVGVESRSRVLVRAARARVVVRHSRAHSRAARSIQRAGWASLDRCASRRSVSASSILPLREERARQARIRVRDVPRRALRAPAGTRAPPSAARPARRSVDAKMRAERHVLRRDAEGVSQRA